MAAVTTRMLVLGAVRTFEPVNGYQLMRELGTWHIDEWANVRTGSVYSMLATCTKQGLLTRHDLDEGRAVAVYTVTREGEAEFFRLLEEGVKGVDALDRTPFRVAFSFAPLVARETFAAWLAERLASVRRGAEGLSEGAQGIRAQRSAPPHVADSLELEARVLAAEAQWLGEVLENVRAGGLSFLGEQPDWTPPRGDPGWEISSQRAAYLEALGDVGAAAAGGAPRRGASSSG